MSKNSWIKSELLRQVKLIITPLKDMLRHRIITFIFQINNIQKNRALFFDNKTYVLTFYFYIDSKELKPLFALLCIKFPQLGYNTFRIFI
jgi:hypothetical protein